MIVSFPENSGWEWIRIKGCCRGLWPMLSLLINVWGSGLVGVQNWSQNHEQNLHCWPSTHDVEGQKGGSFHIFSPICCWFMTSLNGMFFSNALRWAFFQLRIWGMLIGVASRTPTVCLGCDDWASVGTPWPENGPTRCWEAAHSLCRIVFLRWGHELWAI
jgi:hypothetical protein